jgi:hypothetical protein
MCYISWCYDTLGPLLPPLVKVRIVTLKIIPDFRRFPLYTVPAIADDTSVPTLERGEFSSGDRLVSRPFRSPKVNYLCRL